MGNVNVGASSEEGETVKQVELQAHTGGGRVLMLVGIV